MGNVRMMSAGSYPADIMVCTKLAEYSIKPDMTACLKGRLSTMSATCKQALFLSVSGKGKQNLS